MPNIFEYKPVLQYILDDINSINNLPDDGIKLVEPYIRNSPSVVVSQLATVKEALDTVYDNIQRHLQNVSIPYDTSRLDDAVISMLSSSNEGLRLLNDGVLTYNLYKQATQDPLLQDIVYQWEQYHAGIDGTLEAEIEPLVNDTYQTLDTIAQVTANALIYDVGDDITDIQKLKENEMLYVESYLRSLEELENAISQGAQERVLALRKTVDIMEQTLNHKKNLTIALKNALTGISGFIQEMYDGTLPEFQSIYNLAITNQITELRKHTKIDGIRLKTILYSAFQDQFKKVTNARLNYKNTLPANIKFATAENLVRQSRTYLDVALGGIVDLAHSAYLDDTGSALTEFITGLEVISRQYDDSMLGMRNFLGADVSMMKAYINQIYTKHRSRTMYNLVG